MYIDKDKVNTLLVQNGSSLDKHPEMIEKIDEVNRMWAALPEVDLSMMLTLIDAVLADPES